MSYNDFKFEKNIFKKPHNFHKANKDYIMLVQKYGQIANRRFLKSSCSANHIAEFWLLCSGPQNTIAITRPIFKIFAIVFFTTSGLIMWSSHLLLIPP